MIDYYDSEFFKAKSGEVFIETKLDNKHMTDFELQIANILKDPKLTEKQRSILLDLDNELRLEIGAKTRRSYHWILRNLAFFLEGRSFEEAKRMDLEKFLSESIEGLSEGSKALARAKIKRFYKWLHTGNLKGKKYPCVVDWISTSRKDNRKNAEITKVLTPKNILALVKKCYTPRDKALIITFWESATRPQEFLNLNIQDLIFSETDCLLSINENGSKRKVRILLAIPYLRNWINHHPLSRIDIAPLWINLRTKKRLTYNGLYLMLQKLKNEIKIESLSPKLFRKSRLKHLSNSLTEDRLKKYSSFKQIYQQPTFFPNAKKTSNLEITKTARLKEDKNQFNEDHFEWLKEFFNKECFSCRFSNPIDAKYCQYCGNILESDYYSTHL